MSNPFEKSDLPAGKIEDAEIIDLFEGVNSMEDLIAKVQEPGVRIKGSDGNAYGPTELAGLLTGLNAREVDIREITRTEGLRKQAALLMLEHARDLSELSDYLGQIDEIPGSDGTPIPIDEIKNGIQAVLDGAPSNHVTRSYGLRTVVERIKDQELAEAA